jgi:hypothetical protein
VTTRETATLSHRELTLADLTDEEARREDPAVLFGGGAKLRFDGPFLAILLEWAERMKQTGTLLVIGYSFRDEHVNEVIRTWFNESHAARVVLLDPNDPRRRDAPQFLQQLAHVDGPKPDSETPRRFVHLVGTAAERLTEAVSTARGEDAQA